VQKYIDFNFNYSVSVRVRVRVKDRMMSACEKDDVLLLITI
jgi:hypothetical protein